MTLLDKRSSVCYSGLLINTREDSRHKPEIDMITATMIVNAIRALGHAPTTCPADQPGSICRIVAVDANFPDHRLQVLAAQSGLEWAFESDDFTNYWVLTS